MSNEAHVNRKLDVRHGFVSGSEFEDLNMSGSQFTNINLSKARFHDINFSDVSFTAANMGGALFKHIGPMPDKDGKQARQRPVTFEEATLCDSTFRKVDMSNVQIIECNTEGMKIDGIPVSDMVAAYREKHTS